jgi:predicted permease
MSWLRQLFSGRRRYDELSATIHEHLEEKIADLIDRGMTREDAERVARRKFGNLTVIEERSREVWQWPTLESILGDLGYALRQFRRSPGFALTAILVLALGTGASVAIFAFVDALLIQPLPYRDPARLTALFESTALGPRFHLSYPDYLDWKRENKVFSSLDVYGAYGFMRRTPTGLEKATGARVSDGFFRTLGITPVLGRDFYVGEDGPKPARAVMISYSAWQKIYGGSPSVLGQTVVLDDNPNIIVGVLPRDFSFAPAEPADFWTILKQADLCGMERGCHALFGVARLKDGVSFATAFADIRAIAEQLEQQYPDSNRDQVAFMLPLTEVIVGDIRPVLIVALCGGVLLLLIASMNVASLLLVRSESRKREMAVRGALGASARRLTRQIVTEGFLLAGIGGGLGLLAARESIESLTELVPKNLMDGMPFLRVLGLNAHTAIFGLLLMALAGVFFGLAPLSRVRFTAISEGLSQGGRAAAGMVWRRFGTNFVVIELATATVLLACAGLLSKSFYQLLQTDIGMEPNHIATVHIEGDDSKYGKAEQAISLEREMVRRIGNMPGVTSVGLTTRMPIYDADMTRDFRVVGRPYHGEHNEVMFRSVSTGYMPTLKTRLVSGRYFQEDDDSSGPAVVIVNRALARQYFPGEDAVGKLVTWGGPHDPNMLIVGVINDIQEGQLGAGPRGAIYLPFNQRPNSAFSLLVRTTLNDEAFLTQLIGAVHGFDPGLAVYDPATMIERIHEAPSTYLHRSSAWLVGGFAFMALLLGVVGLYGVIAYSVSQRTREIGVRMALGAERRAVYWLVMRQAGWLTLTGLALGLAGAVGAATLIRKMLFGVAAWDPGTLAAVVVVLGAAAMAASFVPARRAASVSPVEALRNE